MNQQHLPDRIFQFTKMKIGGLSVRKLTALLAAILALHNITPVFAWSASDPPLAPEANPSGLAGEEELEAFMDQVIEQSLQEYQIPGVSVSVVKDGRLFFAKGYGYADLEKNIPVDAEKTLFRIGSTSKLFTWTAIMQLVEQGQLDLDRDVNTYLREFQIPATFPQPVTLRHLMTHTAGFEERGVGSEARDAGSMIPMQDYLALMMPARVFPPGQFTSYSNYGAVLAGYIVSTVSGMPLEVYVEQNIYGPLGMTHSTFRQPPQAGLTDDMAVGYSLFFGKLKPAPFEYLNNGPEGSMSSTATDMSLFMIAHLQNGRLGDARILQAATIQEMHRRQFANDPRLDGFTLGFFDMTRNRLRSLEHGGATMQFNTQMALLPDQNTGFFMSSNGSMGGYAVQEIFQEFLDHYYPADPVQVPKPLPDSAKRAALYKGHYRATRFNYTKIDRFGYLTGMGFVQVSASPDGTLSLAFDGPRAKGRGSFIEVEPSVFQETDGPEKLIFKKDANGRISNLFIHRMPLMAFEKIHWYETARFSRQLLIACLAVLLTVPVAFLGGLVRTRRKPDPARIAAFGVTILTFLILAGYLVNIGSIIYGVSPALKVVLGLSLSLPVMAVLLIILTVLSWRRGQWGLIARIHYSLIALAVTGLVWFLDAWNLLGFHL